MLADIRELDFGSAQATTCALAQWEGPGVLLDTQSQIAGCIAVTTLVPAPAAELASSRGRLFGVCPPVHRDDRRAGHVVLVGRPPVFAMTGPSATADAHRFGS